MDGVSTVINLSAADVRNRATWPLVIDAIRDGHRKPRADINDLLVGNGPEKGDLMLVRGAWIDGLAAGVKAATIVPGNNALKPPLPSVHAQIMVFDPDTGQLTGLVDGTEVTAWKTAGDSALGADYLARKDARRFLMVGAGSMAAPLIRAHASVRPELTSFAVWNRTAARADRLVEELAPEFPSLHRVDDLASAAAEADIICCATMTPEPILRGAWMRPGTHVDLVGAFTPTMREADDALHRVGRWFVDSRETTLHHIGELKIPLEAGLITEAAICGDFYDLVAGHGGRTGPEEITVFKNGGGAHLDIMVSAALIDAPAPDRGPALAATETQ
ncbi:MAG: ornithine cyclodeaminase [Pseudomonadota bacterium]